MKFTIAAIALAAIVRAQSLSDIPKCALPCIDDAIANETKCTTTDFACICKKDNFSAIQGAATSCVISECGAETALNEVLPATEKLCSAQDGGSTTTAAAETTSAAAETSSTSSEAAASSSEASTTAVVITTTSVSTISHSATVAPSSVTVVRPPPATNATVTTTGGSTVPTGAAAAVAPIGGLALLGLAVLAL
jgi:hypothetical protein